MVQLENAASEAESIIVQPVEGLWEWAQANAYDLGIGLLVAAGIVGLMLIARTIGHRYVESHYDETSIGFRMILASVAERTTLFFMVAAATSIVTKYADVPDKLDRGVEIFFTIAAAFQAAIWARELIIEAVKSRVGEDPGESTLGNAISIIRVLVTIVAYGLALLVILDNLGVDVTTLIAGFGIGGIAIGLAAQGIFSDLFAALSIVFDRPFRKGDLVKYGTTIGTVEKIGLKTTRIRSIEGEQMIMSNTQLLGQEITNIQEARRRRTTIPFGVVYQTTPEVLRDIPQLTKDIVDQISGCHFVRCIATQFGASSIDFNLQYEDEMLGEDAFMQNKSHVIVALFERFGDEGIEFAYPTQTTFTAAPDGTMIMPYASVQPVQNLCEEEVEKLVKPKAKAKK